MWQSILAAGIRVLCYIGWHIWDDIVSHQVGDDTELARECKRCGLKQKHLQATSGKWEND